MQNRNFFLVLKAKKIYNYCLEREINMIEYAFFHGDYSMLPSSDELGLSEIVEGMVTQPTEAEEI